MKQTKYGTPAMMPTAPLFSSSWVALFRLIREQLTHRATSLDGRAPMRQRMH